MKTIKKFFCEFDFYSAPATLRIKQESQMKTGAIGFISFALAIFFVYIFINSSLQVFNYQKITYTSSRTTIKSNETYGEFRMFGITLDWMDIDQFNSLFMLETYIYKNGTKQKISMRPCLPEDWTLLGDNYKQQFDSYYLDTFFCPDISNNFTLRDTFQAANPDFVMIFLTACDATNPVCNTSQVQEYIENQTYLYSVVEMWVYIIDVALQPDNEKPFSHFINIDTKVQITTTFGGGASVELSAFKINTDVNVLPWEEIEVETGHVVDTVRNFQIGFTNIQVDALAVIFFTLNQKKYLIDRKIGKVDQLLSYAGGLFSLIIAFIGFFIQNYNEYKYELTVAEGVFKNDKIDKISKSEDLNIWTYFKYTIFDWINALFCKQIPWKDCKEINQTRDQIINHMQVDRILRRLTKIQNSLKFCLTNQQEICANLLCTPKISHAKNSRLVLDYNNEITNGRCPLTLEQITTNQDTLKLYFNTEESNPSKINTQMEISMNTSFNQTKKIFGESRIVWGDDQRLGLVSSIMQQFPEIKKQAEEITLDQQFLKVELEITQAFFTLKNQVRIRMQQKIPILILYRLLKRAPQLNETII